MCLQSLQALSHASSFATDDFRQAFRQAVRLYEILIVNVTYVRSYIALVFDKVVFENARYNALHCWKPASSFLSIIACSVTTGENIMVLV